MKLIFLLKQIVSGSWKEYRPTLLAMQLDPWSRNYRHIGYYFDEAVKDTYNSRIDAWVPITIKRIDNL